MAQDRVLHTLLGKKVPPACPLGLPPGAEDLLDDVEYLLKIPEGSRDFRILSFWKIFIQLAKNFNNF